MVGGCSFLLVFVITIPICSFAPNSLDDLTVNINLEKSSKGVLYESGKKLDEPDELWKFYGVLFGEQLRCYGHDDGCCTEENKCEVHEGDCDNHQQCMPGLRCGANNCAWRDCDFFNDCDDCCYKPDPKCADGSKRIKRQLKCDGDLGCADESVEIKFICEGLPSICSAGDALFYPDPLDCTSFYQCSEGRPPYRQSCPAGTRWSSQLGVCDHAVNVQCQVCPETDINYYGNNINNIHDIPNWQTCARKCSETGGCSHWTWASVNIEVGSLRLECFLKTSDSGRTNKHGFVSGASTCQAPG